MHAQLSRTAFSDLELSKYFQGKVSAFITTGYAGSVKGEQWRSTVLVSPYNFGKCHKIVCRALYGLSGCLIATSICNKNLAVGHFSVTIFSGSVFSVLWCAPA